VDVHWGSLVEPWTVEVADQVSMSDA
jgi:hypothetical protein